MGLVDFDRLKTVIVKMWYGSGLTRKETEFTLSQQQPKQTLGGSDRPGNQRALLLPAHVH